MRRIREMQTGSIVERRGRPVLPGVLQGVLPGVLLAGVMAGVLGACDRSSGDVLAEPSMLDVPASPGAAQPFAATSGDHLLLSWTEPAGDGHALRFARWDGSTWSEPATAASGADWFVNWADFPSVVDLGDGVMLAHWLQRSGPGRYSYDVMISRSTDNGRTWSAPQRPHRDGTETEHGFVSLFRHGDGAGAVWLDGRQYAEVDGVPATNEMQLRFAAMHADGTIAEDIRLDDRICDCCQTAVALTDRGPVVAYRDRTDDEVRDISVTRLVDGAWTAPQPLHADNWVINACPVNGPAAHGDGDVAVVAWFTAANDTPRVRVAFSGDGGETFGQPVTVDDGNPIGRVDVLLLDGDRALVVWLERVGEDAEVRGRIVRQDGGRGEARTLAATISGRSGGFPRMARRGDEVILSWTEPGEPSRIRAAVIPLD
jgi:hypothetical protein